MGEIVEGTLVSAPCTECPLDDHEVLLRVETRGGWVSYAINYPMFGLRMAEVYPMLHEVLPKMLHPILDGAMFALRHGIIQKLARQAGVNPDIYLNRDTKDKDAAAAQLAMIVVMHNAKKLQTQDDNLLPIDVEQKDLVDAYQGVLRRVPQYDALPHPDLAQIAGEGPAGE